MKNKSLLALLALSSSAALVLSSCQLSLPTISNGGGNGNTESTSLPHETPPLGGSSESSSDDIHSSVHGDSTPPVVSSSDTTPSGDDNPPAGDTWTLTADTPAGCMEFFSAIAAPTVAATNVTVVTKYNGEMIAQDGICADKFHSIAIDGDGLTDVYGWTVGEGEDAVYYVGDANTKTYHVATEMEYNYTPSSRAMVVGMMFLFAFADENAEDYSATLTGHGTVEEPTGKMTLEMSVPDDDEIINLRLEATDGLLDKMTVSGVDDNGQPTAATMEYTYGTVVFDLPDLTDWTLQESGGSSDDDDPTGEDNPPVADGDWGVTANTPEGCFELFSAMAAPGLASTNVTVVMKYDEMVVATDEVDGDKLHSIALDGDGTTETYGWVEGEGEDLVYYLGNATDKTYYVSGKTTYNYSLPSRTMVLGMMMMMAYADENAEGYSATLTGHGTVEEPTGKMTLEMSMPDDGEIINLRLEATDGMLDKFIISGNDNNGDLTVITMEYSYGNTSVTIPDLSDWLLQQSGSDYGDDDGADEDNPPEEGNLGGE